MGYLNNLISPSALACACNRAASEDDNDICLCPIEGTIPICPFGKSCDQVTESDWDTYLSSFRFYRVYNSSECDSVEIVHECKSFRDDYKLAIIKKISGNHEWYKVFLCIPKSIGITWTYIQDNIKFDLDIDPSNVDDNDHRNYICSIIESDYDIYHWEYNPFYVRKDTGNMRRVNMFSIFYDADHIVNQINDLRG